MKRGLIAWITIVGIALIATSKSRLKADAEALAEVIAERIVCNLTPTYRGFDAVSGVYDFDLEDQRNFKQAYDHYFAATSNRLSALTAEQRKLLCENVELTEEDVTQSIID